MRDLVLVLFAAAVSVIYGEGRVMAGAFGLSFASLRSSFVLVSAFLFASLLLRLAFVQGAKVSIKKALSQRAIDCVKYAFIVVASCVVAEIYIAVDELNFKREVSGQKIIQCARPRAWPFAGTSILYDEQRGFWATD